MKCFLPGPSLIFLQIELELRPSPWSPSKTGGNSLKSLMKGMGGWEGRYSACFCFLISFARSLRNEQALMGEISHHLGSMGGLPPSWIAESGFQSGFVQGEGRDSWLDICRHHSTWGLNMLSSYRLWSDQIPPIVSWSFNKYLLSISSVAGLCASAKDSHMKTLSLPWKTSQSSIRVKQGNKPQYSVYALMEACARDSRITGMMVGFPGDDDFDLCFEGRGRVEAGKAGRVTLD